MSERFDLQIAHSVAEIGQETWDRLSGTRPYSSYQWHRFCEAALDGDLPVYILVFQHGEPVARATFWLTQQDPLPISPKIVRTGLQAAFRRWPLLICRTPFVHISGLILPESPLCEAALEVIAQAAQQIGKQHKISVLFFDYLKRDETGPLPWPEGYTSFEMSEPGTHLEILWPDFEGFLTSLSKSTRRNYRRHMNLAAELGIEIKAHSKVSSVDDALALIWNVDLHHDATPTPCVRSILENLELIDATWITAEIGDRLVGCNLLLGDREVQTLTLLGLDYSVTAEGVEGYAYFPLMYEGVRHAIEKGARMARGGSGAYEFKQRLGFQVEQNYHIAFTTRSPILRRIARWVAN